MFIIYTFVCKFNCLYPFIYIFLSLGRRTIAFINGTRINVNNSNNNINNNNIPEIRKYWVNVQRGIVSSHVERDPL